MTAINRDEWLTALTDAGLHTDDDPTAITIGEFCEMFGVNQSVARRHLHQLVATGKATQTHKKKTSIAGKTINYVAFRLA